MVSNDLWFTEIGRHGIHDYVQYFIMDVSKVSGGKMDEAHAVTAALEIACSPDWGASRHATRDPHVKAIVYRIGENGEREHACSAVAKLVDGRYIDHCGEFVRSRDMNVVMFAVGDPV